MTVQFISKGDSRSFPNGLETSGNGIILAGDQAGELLEGKVLDTDADFIALELGHECLSQHVGLTKSAQFERVVGFARFRLGNEPPGRLIELVRQSWTCQSAIDAAREAFVQAGFEVAVCNDRPGRIVNRLIRPYLNAVLRRFEEGLATKEGLDKTMCMGLGYPEGPMALLERTGLEHHFDASQALYEALGNPDFAPAPRARAAKFRFGSTGVNV